MWITWAVPLSDGSELAPGAGAALLSSTSHLPRGFRCSSSPPPLRLGHSGDDRTRRDLLGHKDAPLKGHEDAPSKGHEDAPSKGHEDAPSKPNPP